MALLLRLYQIGVQEVWLDEAFSSYMATTGDLLRGLLADANAPLYYLLLRGWVRLAGQGEAVLRIPSAVFGTLFVLGVIWAAREFFDEAVALWSGAAAAVAPLHIYYSQEARCYALLTLEMILTVALLCRALTTNAWRWWGLMALGALAALYTHYFAVLGLLPTAFLVWSWPAPGRWPRYTVALLASGLLTLPWVAWSLVLTPHLQGNIDFIRVIWEAMPPWLAIPRSLEVFGLGSQANLSAMWMKQFGGLAFPVGLRVTGIVLLVLLGLLVILPWGDRRVGIPALGRRKAWLALQLFFPLTVLWLASFHTPIYLAGRYDLVAFPAYLLLLGLALRKLQRMGRFGPSLALLVTLLLLIPVGTKLVLYYQAPPIGTARATAKILDAEVPNGDVVVFTGLRGLPILYYLEQSGYRWEGGECRAETTGRRFGCRMYPRETETTPADFTPGRVEQSPAAVHDDLEDFLRPLRATGGDLWVAFDRADVSQQTIHLLWTDSLLFQEFQRLDLTFIRIQGAPALFRFRQTPDK